MIRIYNKCNYYYVIVFQYENGDALGFVILR